MFSWVKRVCFIRRGFLRRVTGCMRYLRWVDIIYGILEGSWGGSLALIFYAMQHRHFNPFYYLLFSTAIPSIISIYIRTAVT